MWHYGHASIAGCQRSDTHPGNVQPLSSKLPSQRTSTGPARLQTILRDHYSSAAWPLGLLSTHMRHIQLPPQLFRPHRGLASPTASSIHTGRRGFRTRHHGWAHGSGCPGLLVATATLSSWQQQPRSSRTQLPQHQITPHRLPCLRIGARHACTHSQSVCTATSRT